MYLPLREGGLVDREKLEGGPGGEGGVAGHRLPDVVVVPQHQAPLAYKHARHSPAARVPDEELPENGLHQAAGVWPRGRPTARSNHAAVVARDRAQL